MVRQNYFAFSFFAVFTFILFWRIVISGEVVFTGDNFDLLFPQKHFWLEEIKQGRLPLWNPYILSGTPYLADINLGTFAPSNFIYFLVKPVEKASSYLLIFDFFLIGFFTFLSARHLQISYVGSIISGLVFMGSGIVMAYLSNLAILNVLVFLPMIFYSWQKALEQGKYRWVIVSSLFFACQILSGHVQILITLVYLSCL